MRLDHYNIDNGERCPRSATSQVRIQSGNPVLVGCPARIYVRYVANHGANQLHCSWLVNASFNVRGRVS